MKRLSRYAVLGVVLAVACAAGGARLARAADAGGALKIPGTIEAVTVYRGQALVTRVIDVPGPAGAKEVVVPNLPDQVEPGSIYAEGEGAVEIRSVSYSVQPVANDVREEVQKLDDQIKALQDKITANQREHQVIQAERDYLGKLAQFTAGTSTMELTKGVLNADTLKQLTTFQFEKTEALAKQELTSDMTLRDFNEQLQTLQRQRGQVAGGSAKMAREAHVFMQITGNGGKMRLGYVVDNASWSPSYNVRANSKEPGKITVEYLASIQQLTGEDWSNVHMMLSTATPSLVAKAPLLNELAITSKGGQPSDVLTQLQQSGSAQARQDLMQQRTALEQFRGTIGNGNYSSSGQGAQQQANQAGNTVTIGGAVLNLDYIGDNNDVDLVLNKTAGDLQLLDLLAREKIARVKDGKPSPLTPDEGLVITYDLKNNTSLQSRSDRQLIRIDTLPMTAEFYKVASPVLSTYVYNEASATNTSPRVFLWGDVATYMDNEFVGRGVMPSVAIGQRFTVGLGIDSTMRTRRELVEKTETPVGQNRQVVFTYKLWIENFGEQKTAVHLLDRLPSAKEDDTSITVMDPKKIEATLSDPKDAKAVLSDDPIYQQTDLKKKLLRWDVNVPGKAVDDKAFSLEYQFNLQYGANAVITTPAAPANPAANPGQNSGNGNGFGGGGGAGGGIGGRGGAGGRGG